MDQETLRLMKKHGIDLARYTQALKEEAAGRKARELAQQRQTEDVVLPVETHVACGGQIVHCSSTRWSSPETVIIGTLHHSRPEGYDCYAYCQGCGSGISDPGRLKQYKEQMMAYRRRTT